MGKLEGRQVLDHDKSTIHIHSTAPPLHPPVICLLPSRFPHTLHHLFRVTAWLLFINLITHLFTLSFYISSPWYLIHPHLYPPTHVQFYPIFLPSTFLHLSPVPFSRTSTYPPPTPHLSSLVHPLTSHSQPTNVLFTYPPHTHTPSPTSFLSSCPTNPCTPTPPLPLPPSQPTPSTLPPASTHMNKAESVLFIPLRGHFCSGHSLTPCLRMTSPLRLVTLRADETKKSFMCMCVPGMYKFMNVQHVCRLCIYVCIYHKPPLCCTIYLSVYTLTRYCLKKMLWRVIS